MGAQRLTSDIRVLGQSQSHMARVSILDVFLEETLSAPRKIGGKRRFEINTPRDSLLCRLSLSFSRCIDRPNNKNKLDDARNMWSRWVTGLICSTDSIRKVLYARIVTLIIWRSRYIAFAMQFYLNMFHKTTSFSISWREARFAKCST